MILLPDLLSYAYKIHRKSDEIDSPMSPRSEDTLVKGKAEHTCLFEMRQARIAEAPFLAMSIKTISPDANVHPCNCGL